MHRLYSVMLWLTTILGVQAQERITPQTNTFNSNFSLTQAQIEEAQLSNITANNVNVALNFERSNWATGSVSVGGVPHDDFYTTFPKNASSSNIKPGSVLKVQPFVNASYYSMPPTLAISRFVFVTETFNGTAVPASAYILWPYMPLNYTNNTIPTVTWAHGTSGTFPECGPSHLRDLWYSFSAPYTLALAGYAVVAPDFAGLGVPKTAEGEDIVNQYLAFPAHANDMIYATEAAQAAFSELSRDFAVVGHSQGGGVAWATAQRQAIKPVPGYLGTIAGSPVSNVSKFIEVFGLKKEEGRLWLMIPGMLSIFPSLKAEDLLTDVGVRTLKLGKELQVCNTAMDELVTSKDKVIKDGWLKSYYTQLFQAMTGVGGRKIAGPMLVMQGDADTTVPEVATNQAVNETCEMFPDTSIEYWQVNDVTHVPVMYATQRLWLNWLYDLFFESNNIGKPGCVKKKLGHNTPRPVGQYQKEINYFLEWANQPYEG